MLFQMGAQDGMVARGRPSEGITSRYAAPRRGSCLPGMVPESSIGATAAGLIFSAAASSLIVAKSPDSSVCRHLTPPVVRVRLRRRLVCQRSASSTGKVC